MAKAKENTTKTILIVGGILGGIYLLSRTDQTEKIKELLGTIGSLMPTAQIPNINLPFALPEGLLSEGLLSEDLLSCFPALTLPKLPGLPSIPDITFPGLPGLPESNVLPKGDTTWADVAYSLPDWAKGTAAVVGAGLAGYGGYQILRVTSPILKQLGIQSAKAVGGAGNIIGKLVSKAVTTKIAGQVVKTAPKVAAIVAPKVGAVVLTKVAPKVGTVVATKVAPKVGAVVATKVGVKIGAKIAGKVALKAVPFVGWGMLIIDAVADISRLFGAKPPGFMGFIPIIEAISGEAIAGPVGAAQVATRTTELAALPTMPVIKAPPVIRTTTAQAVMAKKTTAVEPKKVQITMPKPLMPAMPQAIYRAL